MKVKQVNFITILQRWFPHMGTRWILPRLLPMPLSALDFIPNKLYSGDVFPKSAVINLRDGYCIVDVRGYWHGFEY